MSDCRICGLPVAQWPGPYGKSGTECMVEVAGFEYATNRGAMTLEQLMTAMQVARAECRARGKMRDRANKQTFITLCQSDRKVMSAAGLSTEGVDTMLASMGVFPEGQAPRDNEPAACACVDCPDPCPHDDADKGNACPPEVKP